MEPHLKVPAGRFLALAVAIGIMLSGSATPAGQPESPTTSPSVIRSDIFRVVVPVIISNTRGEIVPDIGKNDLRLQVDGRPVRDFELLEDQHLPTETVVTFDHSSGQVMKHLGWLRLFLRGLIHHMTPDDEFTLSTFGRQYVNILEGCSDRTEIMSMAANLHPQMFSGPSGFFDFLKVSPGESAHDNIPPPNKTAIALDHALYDLAQSGRRKKALIIATDGDENLSKITLHHVQWYGVPVFVIYFPGSGIGQHSLFRRGSMARKLVEESGGTLIRVRKKTEAEAAGQAVARMIRGQYLVTFTPMARLNRKKTHEITLKLDHEDLEIKYRKSFRFVKE